MVERVQTAVVAVQSVVIAVAALAIALHVVMVQVIKSVHRTSRRMPLAAKSVSIRHALGVRL